MTLYIFGSTDDKLCKKFDKLMQSKYEMSMMGELIYFLGLQVKSRLVIEYSLVKPNTFMIF